MPTAPSPTVTHLMNLVALIFFNYPLFTSKTKPSYHTHNLPISSPPPYCNFLVQSSICFTKIQNLQTSIRANCKTHTHTEKKAQKKLGIWDDEEEEKWETLTLLEEIEIMHEGMWVVVAVVAEWDEREREKDKNFSNPTNFAVEAFVMSTNLCQLYYYYCSLFFKNFYNYNYNFFYCNSFMGEIFHTTLIATKLGSSRGSFLSV